MIDPNRRWLGLGLESGREMVRLDEEMIFEPPLEENNVVLVDEEKVRSAEQFVVGCEHCCQNAEITLDYVIDALTGNDPTCTEYVLIRPVRCPRCKQEVTEKTLVAAFL